MRSIMTRYPLGSAIFTPPSFTKSAETPSTLRLLIRSITAGGKVFSIPKIIPTFFVFTKSPKLVILSEVMLRKAKHHAVEGPLRFSCPMQLGRRPNQPKYFTAILTHQGQSCRYDLPKRPTNAAHLWHEAWMRISHSRPDTYPTRPRPA